MKPVVLILVLFLYFPLPVVGQRLVPPRKYHSEKDEDHPEFDDDEDDGDGNATDSGPYLGEFCEISCNSRLQHVYCNKETRICECEKKYPVRLNPEKGCEKPKKLGEQCYFDETCVYSDQHSSCKQIHHNAVCQCKSGYHSVSVQKPSKRLFCAEDLVVMTTNFSTFAGVLSGIAVLSGLICFVLKLFNQNLYTGRHRYGNANLAPPIMFSSDAGSLPMPIMDRSLASRASSNRTYTSVASRRTSSAAHQGGRGIAVSASRAGSRRPSITSVHSSNSIKSFSAKRYEREREQKEEREMQRRLARMTSSGCGSSGRIPPTPSPHSTDDLLPTLEENKPAPPLAIQEEIALNGLHEEVPSTSKQFP